METYMDVHPMPALKWKSKTLKYVKSKILRPLSVLIKVYLIGVVLIFPLPIAACWKWQHKKKEISIDRYILRIIYYFLKFK